MKDYLDHTFNPDDPELISIQDELPFWSAPFGFSLLNTIRMKKNINVLDIGSGFGFPLLEVSQRLGKTCNVFGVDPWKPAIERAEKKIKMYNLSNVKIIDCCAEKLPFEDSFFDLIISNNGINNVKDIPAVFNECSRVCKNGAQFVFTFNLDKTMIEFYDIYEKVLKENNMAEEIKILKRHIYEKRPPVKEITNALKKAGFNNINVSENKFYYRFNDAESMFNYSMIKYWFLPPSKKVVPENIREKIFIRIEEELNKIAAKKGEIILTVPFATVDCEKN